MKKKRPGQPTKYKEEYCQRLIEHMTKGLSFKSFAAQLDINIETLHEWSKEHREFSIAKSVGHAKLLEFYEKVGVGGIVGKIKGFNTSAWIFSMKNRFNSDWNDRQVIEQKIDTNVKVISWEENLLANTRPKEVEENITSLSLPISGA